MPRPQSSLDALPFGILAEARNVVCLENALSNPGPGSRQKSTSPGFSNVLARSSRRQFDDGVAPSRVFVPSLQCLPTLGALGDADMEQIRNNGDTMRIAIVSRRDSSPAACPKTTISSGEGPRSQFAARRLSLCSEQRRPPKQDDRRAPSSAEAWVSSGPEASRGARGLLDPRAALLRGEDHGASRQGGGEWGVGGEGLAGRRSRPGLAR